MSQSAQEITEQKYQEERHKALNALYSDERIARRYDPRQWEAYRDWDWLSLYDSLEESVYTYGSNQDDAIVREIIENLYRAAAVNAICRSEGPDAAMRYKLGASSR